MNQVLNHFILNKYINKILFGFESKIIKSGKSERKADACIIEKMPGWLSKIQGLGTNEIFRFFRENKVTNAN